MNTIKNIIPVVIGEMAKKRPQEIDLSQLWGRIAGSPKGSRAAQMKEGRLTVLVDSSARKMQLFRKKDQLLEQLQNKIPTIKTIYFKVGSV
ncbi:MAG: DUF721 domain-containing protein [Candidatus Omnitrophica bacterium]|nr:DUF721 domain-containing protein [Candidatus Omnitrophota bacterium]